jgi:hydrogenase maturation protein HypF
VHGAAWRRVGHLLPLALLGGDRAAREPWRMGIAALHALGRGSEAAQRFAAFPLAGRVAAGAGYPTTTSMGRLFDAASALLGLCPQQSYEGQAAMELEALVTTTQCLPDGYHIADNVLDFRPLLSALLTPGQQACAGAELFHGTLIAGLAAWIGQAAEQLGHTTIVLGGGCLLNRVLADGLADALRQRGLLPLFARAVPTNDGGLSLGQAAMARAHLMTAPLLPQVT